MRFITDLNYETQALLKRFYMMSKKHETRQKAQCILLSNKGFSINQLIQFFDVHLNTIYNWLDGWDNEGLLSLYHKKGQGRKPLLESVKEQEIKDLIIENPKQLKKVISQIAEKHKVKISKSTLIRYIKKTKIGMEENTQVIKEEAS